LNLTLSIQALSSAVEMKCSSGKWDTGIGKMERERERGREREGGRERERGI
jgi:hypothetical protein